jgi:hypothetical protein
MHEPGACRTCLPSKLTPAIANSSGGSKACRERRAATGSTACWSSVLRDSSCRATCCCNAYLSVDATSLAASLKIAQGAVRRCPPRREARQMPTKATGQAGQHRPGYVQHAKRCKHLQVRMLLVAGCRLNTAGTDCCLTPPTPHSRSRMQFGIRSVRDFLHMCVQASI